MIRKKGKQYQVKEEAALFCKGRPRIFKTDAEILQKARILFEVRELQEDVDNEKIHCEMAVLEREMCERFHRTLARSKKAHLSKEFVKHKLDRVECEIILLLALSALGMRGNVYDIEGIQSALKMKGGESLAVVQALAEDSKLVAREFVILEHDDIPVDVRVSASPEFLSPILRGTKNPEDCWNVNNYEELLDRTYTVSSQLRERGEEVETAMRRGNNDSDIRKATHQVWRHWRAFWKTLKHHPDWPLNGINKLDHSSQEMVIVLLGKELGFFPAHDEIFTGDGLARCASMKVPEIRHHIALLRSDRSLRKDGYIRVCGGIGDNAAVEDEATLRTCEFELTQEFLNKIKVKRQRRSSQQARKPLLKMSQLVLSDKVMASIRMAVTQVKHGSIMIDDWGLGSVVPYGNAVTVLFSGSPGVGKTATAEAIADKLGKQIIVINYAEMQSCWVGETEKNIARVFREAAEADAVLFWDEADAMFYDRDSATRNWEVRDVNVLLQELERFRGLCVLSTNRKITLDKALERRIAIKVQFAPPDRAMREKIWKKLLPKKMPLEKGISLKKLSEEDLTGGEIKNVVLNAARIALTRNRKTRITMADFREAIHMEKDGSWNQESRGRLGFHRQ